MATARAIAVPNTAHGPTLRERASVRMWLEDGPCRPEGIEITHGRRPAERPICRMLRETVCAKLLMSHLELVLSRGVGGGD